MLTDTTNLYSAGKVYATQNTILVKKYNYPYKLGKREHKVEKNPNRENFEKREDNLFRARTKVKNVINSNLSPHTKFLTLTTQNTVLDEKLFRRKLTTFFQAMKRENYSLRYLYVLERQKERGKKEGNEGSFHAHIIIFNDEYIPYEIINKHWKGNTDIHILDGLKYDDNEKINSVADYVCKYITKENLNDFNKHCYFTSNNLIKPLEFSLPIYKVADTYVKDKDDIEYIALNTLLEDYKIYQTEVLYSPLKFDAEKIQKTEIKRGVRYEKTAV